MGKDNKVDLNSHRQTKEFGYKSDEKTNNKKFFTIEEIYRLAAENPNDANLGAAIRRELLKIGNNVR